jgi:hypothetical protein
MDQGDVERAVGQIDGPSLLVVERRIPGLLRERRRSALEPRRLAGEHGEPPLTLLLLTHAPQPGGEPLPGHRGGLELEDDSPIGGPVGRRLLEDDRDPRTRPACHHPGRSVVPVLAAEPHTDEAADPDPRSGQRSTARLSVAHERATGQPFLIEGLHVDDGQAARLALGQRESAARLREAYLLLVAFGVEEFLQSVEV